MYLAPVDYTLIIILLSVVIFLAYRFMIYLGKVRSAPGYAKRKAIGYLFLAFISLTGIVPLFRDSIMNAFNLPVPEYFTEYSFGAFVVLAIAAVLIMRNDQHQATTKQKHSGTGDNVARDKVGGDKIGGDKIGGDKIGGDKIGKKEVQGDDVKGDKIVYINQPPKINDPKKLTTIQRVNPDELIGRKKDLEKLHQLLTKKKKVVVVNGMGGIGKTTLAAAYTFQYHDYYKKLVWITQSQEDITNDFVQNAELIQSLNIATEGKQADQLLGEILHALRNITERPKLLVIDNAFESLEQHLDQIPSQPEWEVLVTSRQAIEGLHTMPLDFLSEAEAIALFQKHCSRITDVVAIRELVNTVELHTLTIEILAKTAEKQRSSPSQLMTALEEDLKANIKARHSELKRIDRITSYLNSIFNISNLTEDELWLLIQFHFLPLEFHRYTFLEDLIGISFEKREVGLSETLTEVVSKGWIIESKKDDSYKMHRVIDTVLDSHFILSYMPASYLCRRVSIELSGSIEVNSVSRLKWIPFALRLLKTHLSPIEDESLNYLRINLALLLFDFGNFSKSLDLIEVGTGYFEEHPPKNLLELKELKSIRASFLTKQGNPDQARILYEEILDIQKSDPETNESALASTYFDLASVWNALENPEKAKKYLEKSISINHKYLASNNPTWAMIFSNLGSILEKLDELHEAKAAFEKAISIEEKYFEPNHPQKATDYSNLGLLLRKLGQFIKAKELIERSIEIDQNNGNYLTYNSVIRLNNLALILSDLGHHDKAIQIGIKAIVGFDKILPDTHIYRLHSRANLAGYIAKTGNEKLNYTYREFLNIDTSKFDIDIK